MLNAVLLQYNKLPLSPNPRICAFPVFVIYQTIVTCKNQRNLNGEQALKMAASRYGGRSESQVVPWPELNQA